MVRAPAVIFSRPLVLEASPSMASVFPASVPSSSKWTDPDFLAAARAPLRTWAAVLLPRAPDVPPPPQAARRRASGTRTRGRMRFIGATLMPSRSSAPPGSAGRGVGRGRRALVPRQRFEVDDELGPEGAGDAVEPDHGGRDLALLQPGDGRLARLGPAGQLRLAHAAAAPGGPGGATDHDGRAGALVAGEGVGSPTRPGHIKDELYHLRDRVPRPASGRGP